MISYIYIENTDNKFIKSLTFQTKVFINWYFGKSHEFLVSLINSLLIIIFVFRFDLELKTIFWFKLIFSVIMTRNLRYDILKFNIKFKLKVNNRSDN